MCRYNAFKVVDAKLTSTGPASPLPNSRRVLLDFRVEALDGSISYGQLRIWKMGSILVKDKCVKRHKSLKVVLKIRAFYFRFYFESGDILISTKPFSCSVPNVLCLVRSLFPW